MGKTAGTALKVVAPITSLFGIGDKDDPTYNPQVNQTQAYNDFAGRSDREYQTAYDNSVNGLQNGALTKGLYGEGGLQSQLGTEGNDLASRGYQLTPQDREAYGQASGDVSRLFGQQEQDASKALARRGLGGGDSGAAGAMFSGLAGSKNEMLAKAQTDIAQKRMQDTQQRLQANRQMQQSLGEQGQNMANEMADKRFAAKNNTMFNAAGLESGVNQQGRQANEDAIGHKSKNIGDAVAGGAYSFYSNPMGWMGGKSSGGGSTSSAGAGSSGGGGGSMGGGASGGAFSDEDLKTNVKDGSGDIRSFLDQSGKTAPAQRSVPYGGNEKDGGGDGGGMDVSSMASIASMFSDEDDKQNVVDGDSDIRGFLDSVEPHKYEYKDEVKGSLLGGEGQYVSPMAQELEQTDLGADMVQDTPQGKVVDYGKGFGTLLAAQADLNQRLKSLEGKKK